MYSSLVSRNDSPEQLIVFILARRPLTVKNNNLTDVEAEQNGTVDKVKIDYLITM